jgi:hypothetical protein
MSAVVSTGVRIATYRMKNVPAVCEVDGRDFLFDLTVAVLPRTSTVELGEFAAIVAEATRTPGTVESIGLAIHSACRIAADCEHIDVTIIHHPREGVELEIYVG